MFRFVVLLAIIAVSFGFKPMNQMRSQMTMSTEKPNALKVIAATLLASSMIGAPVMAKEGVGAKYSFFGDAASSPFIVTEDREDPIYSPYSPYGDGSKAAYKLSGREGSKEEIAFWSKTLNECIKRVDKVPSYVENKRWFEVTTELARYTYNMREAMNRLSAVASSPKDAKAIAKSYFVDLNDMNEWAVKKTGAKVLDAYTKSKEDMAKFTALLK